MAIGISGAARTRRGYKSTFQLPKEDNEVQLVTIPRNLI